MDACLCMVDNDCQNPMHDLVTCVSSDSSDSKGEQWVQIFPTEGERSPVIDETLSVILRHDFGYWSVITYAAED